LQLAKDLEVLEPKHPDQIYKTHLENRKNAGNIDSAKMNQAASFVNAFVNAGMGKDALMIGFQKIKNLLIFIQIFINYFIKIFLQLKPHGLIKLKMRVLFPPLPHLA
jgi:RPN1 N-terminal domain